MTLLAQGQGSRLAKPKDDAGSDAIGRDAAALPDPYLYRWVCDVLKTSIESGEYPIGGMLPTELEISRQLGVSRHTVREALRILSGANLIDRRRRVGTVVTAPAAPRSHVQSLSGFEDMLRLGHDIRLVTETYDRDFSCSLTDDLGLDPRQWLRVDGRRGDDTYLIGLTTIAVRRNCAPSRAILGESAISFATFINACADPKIGRIDQEISAIAMNWRTSHILNASLKGPALRSRRLYYRPCGVMFIAVESIHPADRFSYRLSFTRE